MRSEMNPITRERLFGFRHAFDDRVTVVLTLTALILLLLAPLLIFVVTRAANSSSEKMYKTRIKQWNLSKHNNTNRVAHMVRMRKEREAMGKKSRFAIEGPERTVCSSEPNPQPGRSGSGIPGVRTRQSARISGSV